jgi:hypothetical protein
MGFEKDEMLLQEAGEGERIMDDGRQRGEAC